MGVGIERVPNFGTCVHVGRPRFVHQIRKLVFQTLHCVFVLTNISEYARSFVGEKLAFGDNMQRLTYPRH